MTRTRVLIFPSCNEPGLELIRSLLDQPGIEVHGGSCHPPHQDPSAGLLRRFTTFPALGDPAFGPTLERYLRYQEIDLVFPTMEQMVCEFSTWSTDGVRFVAPSPEVAAIAASKARTHAALAGIVPLPALYPGAVPEFPVYGRPPIGSGGRGNMLITNADQLRLARQNGLLVCEYLPGSEIVAYGLGDPDGRLVLCLTKTTGQWRGGSSYLGALHDDPVIRQYAAAIANRLRLLGPWFAQFRQDRHGQYRLMDLNARLGGGAGLCRLAGVNFALLAVQLFTGRPINPARPIDAISWVRSLKGCVTIDDFDRAIWDMAVFTRPGDGKLRPQAIAALIDLSNRGITQDAFGQRADGHAGPWPPDAFFGHRYSSLADALATIEQPARTLLISGNPAASTARPPALRLIAPDALDILGNERL